MSPKDDTWQDHAKYIRDGAKRFLETKGFGDHDIDDLRLAKPLESAPKESGVEPIFHLFDPKPRAEIVATARVIAMANAALSADELGRQDLATYFMYKLGMLEQQARVFIASPGKNAEIVKDADFLPVFVHILDKGATSDAKGRYKRKVGRKIQAAEEVADRNKKLCEIARALKDAGVKDRNLPTETRNYFDLNDLWTEYDSQAIESRQIKAILQNGKILPKK